MPILNAGARQLMRRQYSLITRPQAIAVGNTPGAVDGYLRRGHLEAVDCGTYRLAGAAPSPEQQLMAAVLRCRPDARLTGETVLGLLGVEGFTTSDTIVVLVPKGRRVQNVPFTVRSDPQPAADRALVADIPGVTAARALVDAGWDVFGKRLRVGVDSLVWLGLASVTRIGACATALLPHHLGAQNILRLIASGVFDQESEGERELATTLETVEPPPRWQVWIAPDIRVDALFEDVGYIPEYDGKQHRLPYQRVADALRAARIKELGYEHDRFGVEDLRNPAAVRARVLGRLAQLRARRLGIGVAPS